MTVVLLAWLAAWAAAGVVLGLAGRRRRRVRYVVTWGGPVFAAGLFVYALFFGGPDECRPYPGPPGYACHSTSMLSSVGWFGVVVIVAVTVVSLAPLAAARGRTRTPSVLGAIILAVLIAVFFAALLLWIPADAAVLAAAIAGPPNTAKGSSPAGTRLR